LAEGLGFFRLVPDFGVFQFAVDFDQPLIFGFIVKETPSALDCALASL
jgi:hypothetical protein